MNNVKKGLLTLAFATGLGGAASEARASLLDPTAKEQNAAVVIIGGALLGTLAFLPVAYHGLKALSAWDKSQEKKEKARAAAAAKPRT
jgi:hypothetical protein